ncbi:dipeptide ABC transporter ATP-binding protein [Spelaeicoccus albus]|uniref:Peptide/nickel transport system ATP-binding protein n=1 Tax=Spelaeicoccus albus TaxID=1280376 RepID=A0A7Z0A9B9_9MICO|nr:ABC transporter ATP-binding protein [Spelaeicoccus albus]NYI66784.1 peptide/nickel transport system ATP-binding protein [Spelaeicoccus albus]
MSNTETPLLKITDLEVGFKARDGVVHAVRKAGLTVYPGQTVAIVGESGSGKSTLAHSIMRLLPGNGSVLGGSIEFDGQELTTMSDRRVAALRGSSIGLVPQDPMSNLNPLWRIGFQVKETLKANRIAKGSAADQRVAEVLSEAGLPDARRRARQFPHEFSGGMRQRALIAIGLAARPKLLVADEPTSALDVTVQHQILGHLDGLTSELGVAVLLITHDLGLAAERAEHLVVMYKGQVVESGSAREILQDPQHPYTRRLVHSAPSLASRRLETEHRAAAATSSAEAPAAASSAPDDVVFEADHLTKEFTVRGEFAKKATVFKAVDDVSFRLKRGTTMALVGESGSGKSTVAQMALRLLRPTSGRILFEGRDIAPLTGSKLLDVRRKVQPIFQNPYGTLDPMYSIYRTIEEPLRVHGIGSQRERSKKIHDLLEKVALPASTVKRYPNELSGGQRQRVAIARALALDPEVVICDEAVSALDVLVQDQILRLLDGLQSEFGLTYLFITHDLAVVRQIADDVLVMKSGKLIEAASTDEIFDNPKEEYTRGLLAAIPGADIPLSIAE